MGLFGVVEFQSPALVAIVDGLEEFSNGGGLVGNDLVVLGQGNGTNCESA